MAQTPQLGEADCAVKVPGSAFRPEMVASRRGADFRPGFGPRHELEAFEARQRLAQMNDAEREAARLRHLASDEACTGQANYCGRTAVRVSLFYGEGLTFCKGCADPHEMGSHMDTWEAHYSPIRFHVAARAVLAIPNFAEKRVLNSEQLAGRIAVVFRGGGVAILEKVLKLQEAGAVATLLVDFEETDGGCTRDFDCGPRLGRRPADHHSLGFAAADRLSDWRAVHIPVVLVHSSDGQRLIDLMETKKVRVPGVGEVLMTKDELK